MIAYSVKVAVDRDVEQEWLRWMIDEHIPDVMGSGFFTDYRMHKTIDRDAVPRRVSYTIHYFCETIDHYNRYEKESAPALQQAHTKRFEGRFKATRVVSEVLERK